MWRTVTYYARNFDTSTPVNLLHALSPNPSMPTNLTPTIRAVSVNGILPPLTIILAHLSTYCTHLQSQHAHQPNTNNTSSFRNSDTVIPKHPPPCPTYPYMWPLWFKWEGLGGAELALLLPLPWESALPSPAPARWHMEFIESVP
jgi:hypothetical protein